MKKTALILLFSIFSLPVFSQKRVPKESTYYTAGKPYPSEKAFSNSYLIKDDQILAIKFQLKKYKLQKFDAIKLNFIGEKAYELEKIPIMHYYPEGLHEVNNRTYFFYSLYDKPNKIEQLFAREIDFQKGEFMGEAQLLLQVEGKVKHKNFRKFETQVSSDKKAITIKYTKDALIDNDKKNFDVIGIAYFDSDLKKTALNEIQMPHTERRLMNLDHIIDGKGNLYMLAKVFHDDSQEDKKSKSDTQANYHIEIFTIKSGSNKVVITKLDDKEKFINSLKLFDLPKSGQIIAGGYYSNGKGKNFEANSDGVVTFKMSDNGILADKKYYDIPMDVINQYESAKVRNKNERKEENGEGAKFTFLKLKDLEVLDDGSIVLVGEQYIEVTQNSNVGRGGSVTTVKYNDILVAKINPDGQLGWMRKIPKQQFGSVPNDKAFKFLHSATDLFVLYLDNIKNIDLAPDQEPARHLNGEGGYLTSVKMNVTDGSFTKTSILNTREMDEFKLQRLNYSNTMEVADNSFIVEAPKSDSQGVLVKITLK